MRFEDPHIVSSSRDHLLQNRKENVQLEEPHILSASRLLSLTKRRRECEVLGTLHSLSYET